MKETAWLDDAISKAITRTRGIAIEVTDFPHITEAKQWRTTPDGVWTGGFWAGLLWLAYENNKDPVLLKLEISYTDRLLPRSGDKHNHDLGFMFYPSAIKGWKLTGQQRYHDAAMAAAEGLAHQYNHSTGFIPGWGFFGGEDWSGSVLVDTLMNLPLLVWAVKQGGNPKLMDVVRGQANVTLKNHQRSDGSFFHVFKFDSITGAPLSGDTYQGLAPDSFWARGQSWAITGLAILAQMTDDKIYLDASKKVAAYFESALPEDSVPPWDFAATGTNQPKDASAGAIASYGFEKLYRFTRDRRYLDIATRLLKALASTCGNGSSQGGLLLHATADLPHGLGIDESTMYGDYHYLKSLLQLRAHLV